MSYWNTLARLMLAAATILSAFPAPACYNWANVLPSDARDPRNPRAARGDPDKDCIWGTGTIIQCSSQTLAETVPLTGTSFALRYSSDRTSNRKADLSLNIPLSGTDVPASLQHIDLDVVVAGRHFTRTFPPLPGQTTSFAWDGIDAYGRSFKGPALATVRVGYAYQTVHGQPAFNLSQVEANFTSQSFAMAALSGRLTSDPMSTQLTWWQQDDYFLGTLPGPIGGWTLNVHHSYNPVSTTLLLGDGPRRSTQAIDPVITTVAGTLDPSAPGGDGPATLTKIGTAAAVAIAPDGRFVFADSYNSCIRRVDPSGYMYHLTACPGGGFGGDGGFSVTAFVSSPAGVAVARDGSVYIADCGNSRIRRIERIDGGIITTVAGNGTAGFSGDGGPATAAQLSCPLAVAAAPDGSLYIADNNRIRRIGLDGFINTVAGTGTSGFSGDGGPAINAQIGSFQNAGNLISVAQDGNVLFVDRSNRRVRRIGIDGIINTVAGNGASGSGGDGSPATLVPLNIPLAVAAAPDGSYYIADIGSIHVVGQDGIIRTFAGNGLGGSQTGEGGPATSASGVIGTGLAVGPDGSILHGESSIVRRVASKLPGFAGGDLLVPSEDASELYHFDESGRHLETLNVLTGTVRYHFAYDSSGRLISVTDGDGNITSIQRDANGNPTAITAPGGQITTLAVDGNGYLSRIANPAGAAMNFSYTADGLLTTETDARGGVHKLDYDALGRLVRDEDPAGGVTTLSRSETANGHQVTITTAGGRSSTTTYERLPTGEIHRINSDDAGAQTTVVSAPNGSIDVTYPDGTHTTIQQGPDPRFGMLAPVFTSVTHSVPGGPTLTQTTKRTTTLADFSNPLSVQTLNETVTVNGRTFTSVYDAASRTLTSTSPEGRQTIDIIDAQQRVVSKQLGAGLTPLTATFDAHGRITQRGQGPQGFTFAYDSANRVISRIDGLGKQTTYAYDAVGRATQVTLPGGRTLHFAYDANGNRTQIVMPSGDTHALAYTPVDLEQSYTPPGNAPYLLTYNGDRDPLTVTLPDGRALQNSYDAIGRDSAYTYPEAKASFAYAAGDSTKRLSHATWTPASSGTVQDQSFTYSGRYVTGATWTGVAQGQFSYAYDSNFFMSAMQFANGSDNVQVALLHDGEGFILGYGPFTMQRNGPAGALSQITDGTLTETLTYDALGQVTTRAQSVAGQQGYQAQYSYDNAGRVTRKVEAVAGTSHTYDYAYDADGRLITVSRDGTVAESYVYDANGNRASRQLGAGPIEAATFDAQDRLVQQGATSYQFDVDGFLVHRGTDTFAYSVRGELLSATAGGQTISYTYDGIGRRVGRTTAAGTTQYFYGDPGNAFLVTQVRDSAGLLTTLFYDEAGLVFALQRGTSRFYVATDQVGTPRVVVDSTGTVVKMLQADAFGNITSDSNPGFELPIAFAGGIADDATALVRFGFRDYDAIAGRWMARDPVEFRGGQENLFVYVGNDPINRRDPMGLWCVGGSAYLGLGAGASLCCHGFFGGCTACVEGGVGAGASATISGGSGSDTGISAGVEGKLGCGPVSVGGEVTATWGCLRAKLKASLGPISTDGAKVKFDQKNDDGRFQSNIQVNSESGSIDCKAQAKARVKLCV